MPIRTLIGFERISLQRGEKRTVTFTITPRQMSLINDGGKRVIEPGAFLVSAGPGKPSSQFHVTGSLTEVPELK